MTLLANTLLNLLHGKEDCCCLCFESTEADALRVEDEVVIDGTVLHLSEILEHVLDNKDVDTILPFRVICNQCKSSALNSYMFMKKCKENSAKLLQSIESLSESFNNAIEGFERYKTLFIALNTDDFMSHQYYVNENVEKDPNNAFKRLLTLLLTPEINDKTNIKTEQPMTKANNLNKIQRRKILKTIKEKKSYKGNSNIKPDKVKSDFIHNIPSVPNSTVMIDDNTKDTRCRVCLQSFREIFKLRTHYFKCHYPKDFNCSKCSECFISDYNLKVHVNKYHTNTFCSICGKHFINKYVMQKHEINHNLKIVCQECGRVYRSKEAFKKHITDDVCKHKMRKNSKEEGRFFCDYCKKGYCYKPYLEKHIKYEHENAEGYKCQFCNKKFYTPSGLKVHTYKHTREKKFECGICGGKFVTNTSLLYHTRLHTGETPYKCEYCDNAFLSASRRLDHMRRYHLEPSLECDICHMKFKTTGSLLKHKKRHLKPNGRLSSSIQQNLSQSEIALSSDVVSFDFQEYIIP